MNTIRYAMLMALLSSPIAAQADAAAMAYGAGCGGLTLTSTNPTIGGVWDLTTDGFPPGSFIVTGFSDTKLDPAIPGGPPWAPGCLLHILPPPTTVLLPPAPPPAVLGIPVPNNAALVGSTLYVQSFAISFGPPWTTSNGIEATIE